MRRTLARLRQAAVAALRRAEALHVDNQKKDELIAMLGHEMRNPLGAVRVGLSLLENCGADEERAATVRATIGRQTDSLVRLADDLLDVARIAQGKLRLDAVPVAALARSARAGRSGRASVVAGLPRIPPPA